MLNLLKALQNLAPQSGGESDGELNRGAPPAPQKSTEENIPAEEPVAQNNVLAGVLQRHETIANRVKSENSRRSASGGNKT